jgi:hypothetical protein
MSTSPAKRPPAKSAVPAAVIAMLLAAAASGCGVAGALTADPAATAGATASPGGAPVTAAGAPVPTVQAGACADGTGSLAAAYATRFRAQLAAAVGGWAAAPPANPAAGAAAQPGLHLVVRSVTSTSNSTDDPSVNDTVPAVPGLAPQPSPADSSYNDDDRAWLDAKPAWQRRAAAAAGQARKLAAEVRAYQVVRGTNSAIWSCLSGAVSELGEVPGASVRLVEMSDFLNNEPVVGLRLASARVLLVTVCSADVSTTCPQRFATARSFALRHGASQVEEISADALTPQILASFWRS